MDIRRTILLMIFSFSLLMLWNNWQVHQGNPSLLGGAPQTTTQTAPADSKATPSADTKGVPASVPTAPVTPSASAAVAGNVPGVTSSASSQAQLVNFKTDVLNLSFDLMGAQLVRADLLAFPSREEKDKPFVLLNNSNGQIYIVQSGLTGAPAGTLYPTHLAPYTLITDQRELSGDQLVIKFASESGGVKLTKTFTLKRGSYEILVDHQIENLSAQPITPAVYLQITRDSKDPASENSTPSFMSGPVSFTGPVVYSDQEKFQKVSFSEIEKRKATYIKEADNGWFAMVQHYFVTAWVPPQGKNRSYEMTELQKNLFAIRSIEPVGTIAPGSQLSIPAKLWVGPQDQEDLEKVAPGLDLVVDYGLLTIIAKPLFSLMTWLHSLLGNWGWTIVVLTILIKAAFYPLSAASYRSMAKMKLVAPRLQALKEKFGDDRQKLNTAMMEMYRTEKINPLGGCLPILVQIPVFISLYYVLGSSVELRGAPWIWWIKDLAVQDPYFILPVVMMGTMFIQMKLNPTPPDPMQAKVMMFMPLVFGAMMFFFPSGLVLYWCVNNILSIAQQWYVMRQINAAAAAAHR
ncbi:membrane protein insertase YidC [Zwartia vadi]|uniref:membrane protein insertase YidC n=1 Tax=Zwartia vadi TaxID=3058168 RepID=UPI0025B5E4FE|nr:membrane protein insertase YidC [Zwartia vadi]MDN3987858.1 membrane protein insertase YidC [Zwartia vadi]